MTQDPPFAGRYDTTRLIRWWDQDRIRKATIVLCGVGAAGNEVAKNLALLGIGRLILVDFDHIEANNLLKTVLFCTRDVGRRKVDVAARALARINPDVAVAPAHGNLVCDTPLGLIHDADLVICALDSYGSRWFLNWVCWETGTPWIDGGLDVLDGRVRTFFPGKTGCLECGFDHRHYAMLDRRMSCGFLAARLPPAKVPTTPTSASIVGGLMVQEAVKLLHEDYTTVGKSFDYHGNFYNFVSDIPARPDCRRDCGTPPLPVVSWTADSSKVTLADLFDFAAETLGRRPLQMEPYARYVDRRTCPVCSWTDSCCYPEEHLLADAGLQLCPECGGTCATRPLDVFCPEDELCRLSLTDLGFPRRHLYRMKTADYRMALVKIDEPAPIG